MPIMRPRESGGQSSLTSAARMRSGARRRWQTWLPSRVDTISPSISRSESMYARGPAPKRASWAGPRRRGPVGAGAIASRVGVLIWTSSPSQPLQADARLAAADARDHLEVVPGLGGHLPVGLGVLALGLPQHPDQVGERGEHGHGGEDDLDREHALLGPVHVLELEQQRRLVEHERDADPERQREVLVQVLALHADRDAAGAERDDAAGDEVVDVALADDDVLDRPEAAVLAD